MHNERDPHTSYRVEVMWPATSDKLTFSITIYPPHPADTQPIIGAVYREDTIPEWLRVAIDLIDMAAVKGDATIPFFGSKAGNTYWLFAQQVYNTKEGT